MKLLPPIKNYDGFTYYMVRRGLKAIVYKQTKNKRTVAFEVFRRKISRGGQGTFEGEEVTFKPRERWPTGEAFGVWAWSFTKEEEAMARFEELERETERPPSPATTPQNGRPPEIGT